MTPAVAVAVVALVTALIALTGLVAAEHALDRAVVAAAAGHDVVAATRGALPARLRSSARVHVVDDVVRLRLDLPGAAPVVELEAVLPGDRP